MTIGELQAVDPLSETFRFDFWSLGIPEEALRTIRRNIYHSSGLGYHIFRNFLDPQIASHMRKFWSELELAHVHQQLPPEGVKVLHVGCPDYYYGLQSGDHRGYLNFFWNHPADEVSYAVAMQVHWLRNRIMGRAPHESFFPMHGRAVSYRTVISKRGEVVTRIHRDWDGDEWIRGPARLQATLYLSTPGIDYDGDGFILETNRGDRVKFGHDVPVANGDLILWRYCNEHSVLNVESTGDQCGFIRMLFPIEGLAAAPPPVHHGRGRMPAPADVLDWLKATPVGHHVLVPIWRRLRGRQ